MEVRCLWCWSVIYGSTMRQEHTRSSAAGRRGDVALPVLAEWGRSVPPAAGLYKQVSPNAALHPLFVRYRLTDDTFPFKMMSETIMPYLIIFCNVGRQKKWTKQQR
ncbi:hypothetical protein NQZ68_016109 [Dissostichus eleginoides]|nr:hypothetical protein NQZ68_016109 [Dissostichus eleginoides]